MDIFTKRIIIYVVGIKDNYDLKTLLNLQKTKENRKPQEKFYPRTLEQAQRTPS